MIELGLLRLLHVCCEWGRTAACDEICTASCQKRACCHSYALLECSLRFALLQEL